METKRVTIDSPFVLQLAAVAFGKRKNNHLVGRARAGDEMLGIEALVLGRDGFEARSDRGPRLCDAFPPLSRFGCLDRLLHRVGRGSPGQSDHVVIRCAANVAG
jgi:hypothetical protein